MSIDIITVVKGIQFIEAYRAAVMDRSQGFDIRVVHLNDLLKAKKAAGIYRDKDDMSHLEKE